MLLGGGGGLAAAIPRSTLPAWALGVHLLVLGLMTFLVATDLEQRRLPHLLLDPLMVVALLFAFIKPVLETIALRSAPPPRSASWGHWG